MLHIEDLDGAQEKVVQFYAEGVSFTEIKDRLCDQYNTSDITIKQVEKCIERSKRKIGEVIRKDEEFSQKLNQRYFDTVSQLNKINEEMLKSFYEIRKDCPTAEREVVCEFCRKKFKIKIKQYGDLVKVANSLLEQIKFVQKTLTKMQSQTMNVNWNITSLTQNLTLAIPKIVQSLVDQKMIKVLNKKRFREGFQT
jgi:hypothetical protein